MQIPYRDFQYLHTDFKNDSITTDNQPGMVKKMLKNILFIIPGLLVLPFIFVFFGCFGIMWSSAK
jgi:hypothetical protein